MKRAALLVSDALHGRTLDHRMDDTAVRIVGIMRSKTYRLMFSLVVLMDCGLAAVEAPSTFRAVGRAAAVWPRAATIPLELLFVALFAADVLLRYRYLGKQSFYKERWSLFKLAFVAVSVVSIVINAAEPRAPRFHRLLRPLMLAAHFRNVSNIFGNILTSVPKVANVAILLCFHVMFFGVMAFVLFGGTYFHPVDPTTGIAEPPRCGSSEPLRRYCSTFSENCMDYFGHVFNAQNQLFILLTTANYPDVMMPVYTCFPYAAIFFVVFLMIGLYFIFNLILAVAYSTFQEHTKVTVLDSVTRRVENMDTAFQLITRTEHFGVINGELGLGPFTDVMGCLRPNLTAAQVFVLFHALDEDGTGSLSM